MSRTVCKLQVTWLHTVGRDGSTDVIAVDSAMLSDICLAARCDRMRLVISLPFSCDQVGPARSGYMLRYETV